MRFILLILLAATTFSAETVNPAVKPTLDTYEAAAAKAYAEYIKATNKAAEKANAALDTKLKAAMKASNLELATVIKKQIDEITKGKTLANLEAEWKNDSTSSLLGPAPMTGTWEMSFNSVPQGTITIAADGKVTNPWKENWTLETKGKVTTINTDKSAMKGITLTDVKEDTMKGTSGIGQVIELKRKKD